MSTMAPRKPKPGKADPTGNPWPAKLKALRVKLNLTQQQAAEKIGVAGITWITWENGTRKPGRLTQRLLTSTFPDLK